MIQMHQLLLQLTGVTASPAQYPTGLSRLEAAHPLAALYKRPHMPARDILNRLNGLPSDAAIPFAWREAAEERAAELPIGYFRFPDKTGYVHSKADAHGVSMEMLDWLLEWVGGEAIRYKLLCPGFHACIEPMGAAGAFRCVTAIEADLDGNGTSPLSFAVKWERSGGVCVRRANITAGPFKPASISVVWLSGELHAFVWLGQTLSPMMRGWFDEKRLYDIARYGAYALAQACGVLPGLYERHREGR